MKVFFFENLTLPTIHPDFRPDPPRFVAQKFLFFIPGVPIFYSRMFIFSKKLAPMSIVDMFVVQSQQEQNVDCWCIFFLSLSVQMFWTILNFGMTMSFPRAGVRARE